MWIDRSHRRRRLRRDGEMRLCFPMVHQQQSPLAFVESSCGGMSCPLTSATAPSSSLSVHTHTLRYATHTHSDREERASKLYGLQFCTSNNKTTVLAQILHHSQQLGYTVQFQKNTQDLCEPNVKYRRKECMHFIELHCLSSKVVICYFV